MRVHRLEITAFGPFPGTEVIDFDPLNDAGIFLLTGPTGAGKTTILDAVCFGLFGAVPGARNGARDLKSHHADDTAVPQVTLEVTIRGRRFRIRRSPAWSRPSRRARLGRVDMHAVASVEEFVAGSWVTSCTRIDEAGLLVSRVLGMDKGQFCQVVMLPQGLFQTFLRAGAKERHDVLESLFETRRFGRIEAWLTERRRACERALEQRQAQIRDLLARAHEVAGDLDQVREVQSERSAYPAARRLLADTLDATTAAAVVAGEVATAASGYLKQAHHALDHGREVRARQTRHREAQERLRELEAIRDVVESRELLVERAGAARSFAPMLAMLDGSDRSAAEATERLDAAFAACPGAPSRPEGRTPKRLDALVTARRDGLAQLELMSEVEDSVHRLTARVSQDDADLSGLEARRAAGRAAASALPALLAEAHEQLGDVAELALTEPAAELRVARAEQLTVAARDAAELAARLSDLRGRLSDSRDARADAQAHWLDLRERRLQGMAAELAGGLTAGVPCLVCGSPRHPAPAPASQSPVTEEAEAAALGEVEAVSAHHEHLVAEQLQLRAELAGCSAHADGLDPAAADAVLAESARDLDAARAARDTKQTLENQIAGLEKRRRGIDSELGELDLACALTERRRLDHVTELDTAQSRLQGAIGPGACVKEAVRQARAGLESAAALAVAAHTHARRLSEAAEVRVRLERALEPTSFSSVAELADAYLSDVDQAVAEALNRSYHDEVRDVTRLVDDPVLVAAVGLPEPELAALDRAVQEAEEQRVQASTAATALATRRDRLEELLCELDAALACWHPLLEQRDLAVAVAAMCAGTSADNSTKTRLAHYVLAARLEQVVEAANLRLSGICGGRYQLEYAMQRGVGDARGGLGLLALDTYTGQRRDPATLSGGETFYVSLALALGLADLVRDEVGGAELSTLFVDEGFGTLDSETLDEVMDEIDSLRAGGRCVGLVSHLSELRVRIPAQLQVVAGRRGSTIAT